ncbi:MAG: hypothetical protein GX840_04390, partial [Bacteroidales bacterium]|nr:hypothetical protein [Bacteroidales bacterium]
YLSAQFFSIPTVSVQTYQVRDGALQQWFLPLTTVSVHFELPSLPSLPSLTGHRNHLNLLNRMNPYSHHPCRAEWDRGDFLGLD